MSRETVVAKSVLRKTTRVEMSFWSSVANQLRCGIGCGFKCGVMSGINKSKRAWCGWAVCLVKILGGRLTGARCMPAASLAGDLWPGKCLDSGVLTSLGTCESV